MKPKYIVIMFVYMLVIYAFMGCFVIDSIHDYDINVYIPDYGEIDSEPLHDAFESAEKADESLLDAPMPIIGSIKDFLGSTVFGVIGVIANIFTNGAVGNAISNFIEGAVALVTQMLLIITAFFGFMIGFLLFDLTAFSGVAFPVYVHVVLLIMVLPVWIAVIVWMFPYSIKLFSALKKLI